MLHYMYLQLDKVKIAPSLEFYFIYFHFVAITYWYCGSLLIKMHVNIYFVLCAIIQGMTAGELSARL